MSNLSQTNIAIIIIAILLLATAVIMGRRLKKLNFRAFGISGIAEGSTPGASVSRSDIEGSRGKIAAEGGNASVADSKIKGDDNQITANSRGG